ncbi:MAG: sulfotransferase family 2 domain-containing protein [Paracoccaceae bacterium]
MPLARIGQVVLFFVHIPKTGGSSIEQYLAEVGQVCLVTRRATGFSTVTPQHMERETYESYIPAAFYDHGFAILRDPVERLLSEFRHQATMSKPHHKVMHHLRLPGSARRTAVAAKAEGFVWRNDFDGWVTAILSACKANPFICDNHIRPQADFVSPGHRLFDFGNGLDPVVRWIDEVAGIAGGAGPAPHQKRTARTPVAISDATRERIAQFYAQDYALIANLHTS